MSSAEVVTPLSETEEGARWAAEKYHVRLDKVILGMLIKLADKKRADENHPLGVQEAKREALNELMNTYPAHRHNRNHYSSTMSHLYGLRAGRKTKGKERRDQTASSVEESAPLEMNSDAYVRNAARIGEHD